MVPFTVIEAASSAPASSCRKTPIAISSALTVIVPSRLPLTVSATIPAARAVLSPAISAVAVMLPVKPLVNSTVSAYIPTALIVPSLILIASAPSSTAAV
jgi:hypothetical protein